MSVDTQPYASMVNQPATQTVIDTPHYTRYFRQRAKDAPNATVKSAINSLGGSIDLFNRYRNDPALTRADIAAVAVQAGLSAPLADELACDIMFLKELKGGVS